MYEKLVVVTRKTRLAQLLERWGSRGQARYAIERTGGDFADYQREDDTYQRALAAVDRSLDDLGVKTQRMERAVVPTYLFAPHDLIVTVDAGTFAGAAAAPGGGVEAGNAGSSSATSSSIS